MPLEHGAGCVGAREARRSPQGGRAFDHRRRRAGWVLILVLALAGTGASGQRTPSAVAVRVVAFGGVSTVPLLIAEERNLFARHGIDAVIEFTPNSDKLREGLGAGRYDVAHAAVDNAIAMVETSGSDVVIVMGHDDSMNELFVQPAVESVRALRGKTIIVDAPNTAYALQARAILLDEGLEPARDYTLAAVGGTPLRLKAMLENRTYAATMLNPPFSIQAKRAGLTSLGRAAHLIGAYQGPGAFVRRAWGREHRDTLVQYIAAYIEALRWFLDPANKAEAVAFLVRRLKLEPDVASQAYARAVDSPGGLFRDAQLSVEGLRNVLKLRARIEGQWKGTPPAPDRYYDLTYREAALASLDGSSR